MMTGAFLLTVIYHFLNILQSAVTILLLTWHCSCRQHAFLPTCSYCHLIADRQHPCLPHFPPARHFTTCILTTFSCSLSLYNVYSYPHVPAAFHFICRQYAFLPHLPMQPLALYADSIQVYSQFLAFPHTVDEDSKRFLTIPCFKQVSCHTLSSYLQQRCILTSCC